MLTFLPFLRAVKAPATSLAVCALILGLAVDCLPAGTSRASQRPAALPPPAVKAGAIPERLADAPLDVPEAGVTMTDAGTASTYAGQISVDLPYPLDARPRAQNPEPAAAEDEDLARWNVGGSSAPSSASSQGSYHPATRVVVDTRPAKRRPGARALPAPRGLTQQRVQAQARSHGYWPFRLCFELGQRDKKGTGGETRVAFTIGTRGKVRAARLLDSKLGNAASAACMVREVLKLEFTPAPSSALRMVASIQVYPGDADLPLEPEMAVLAALPRGDFDAEAMRARVLAKQPELDACFAEARKSDPALWGRLALALILEMDGTVHRVTEVESQFPNAAASRCAQALLSSVVFPSVNGKPFSFVVPLRLSPQEAPTKTGPDADPSPSVTSDDASAD